MPLYYNIFDRAELKPYIARGNTPIKVESITPSGPYNRKTT